MSKKTTNDLYKATRTLGKIASLSNDLDNLKEGRIDKVVKKRVKREIHKDIDKLF
jgi:hypothetical protein